MIYDKIKELCNIKGISISKVESELNLSNGSICKWKNSTPSADKLQKAATYFGVTIGYFFADEESGFVSKTR